MDGRGRALDNVFCERLWRSVKYENIYLNQYDTVRELQTGLCAYFDFYNHERLLKWAPKAGPRAKVYQWSNSTSTRRTS